MKGDTDKLKTAMNLLERASQAFETSAPDPNWFREYYLLTGETVILTEDGWEAFDPHATYQEGYILEIVNPR